MFGKKLIENTIDIPLTSGTAITPVDLYELDLENVTYSVIGQTQADFVAQYNTNIYGFKTYNFNTCKVIGNFVNSSLYLNIRWVIDNTTLVSSEYTNSYLFGHTPLLTWHMAPCQFSTTSEDVYEKTFYGKNGIQEGTLQNNKCSTSTMVKKRVDIWNHYNKGIVCPANMAHAFSRCTNLTEIPLLDTSNVTTMFDMFNSCTNLTKIPLLDTSNVTMMEHMFNNCTNLTEIPLLDTKNVTDMSYMFESCTNLTTVPLLDTSNVTAMDGMFNNCTNLTTVPLLDTFNVTDMRSMFTKCTNLTEIPLLDTKNVTTMSNMFNSCTNLTEIPLLDTSNVTDMSSMFLNCTNLTEIPLLDTKNVTTMSWMFNRCTNLTTVPLLDTSNVTDMLWMFEYCTNLTDESLNNILAMCKNATKISSTKRLKSIGLTSTQANKCKSLSNYQAFVNAGWTTGY